MKPNQMEEAKRWLRQAEHDLSTANLLLQNARHADSCFYSQQAVEKALKALRYAREGLQARGHELGGSSGQLQAVIIYEPSFEKYLEDVGILDQYYTPTRYPDMLPSGIVPYEAYAESQAQEAIEKAERIIADVQRVIGVNG